MKLTALSVDRLPLAASTVIYYDTRLTGFVVRVGKKTKAYVVLGRAAGTKFQVPLGKVGVKPFEDARDRADKILKDAANGIYPTSETEAPAVPVPVPVVLSLRVMLGEYLTARKDLAVRTREDYVQILARSVPEWLDLPMAAITPAMVQVKHAEIGAGSPAGADYVFRVVRALYNYAMEVHEEEIVRNPVRRLSVVRGWYKVGRRKTFVKPVQLPVFFKALRDNPGMLADYLEVLLFTGIRSASEIATLRIQQVDQQEQSIMLADTKNGEELYVPVCDSVAAILKRRVKEAEASGSKFVFYAPDTASGYINSRGGKQLSKIKGLFAGTDLANLVPHDLRRTFLTYADELGIGQAVQKRLVGHAVSQDVTDGYKVLTIERLRKEVKRIERYVLKHGKIT